MVINSGFEKFHDLLKLSMLKHVKSLELPLFHPFITQIVRLACQISKVWILALVELIRELMREKEEKNPLEELVERTEY